ncbi:unnamed protein product [Rhodiola kirilowii]
MSHEDGDCETGSECFSEGSCYSTVFYSTAGGSYDEFRFQQEVELEEIKVCGGKEEDEEDKDCRICHLNLEESPEVAIELGCSCKDDLAVAHKSCAELWFTIKGNKTCEICNSVAHNVTVLNEQPELGQTQQQSESNEVVVAIPSTASENQSCWQGHRVLNFLLGCMVLAFAVSWLFHFNVSA